MKGNIIARIVIYCILIAVLTTILVGSLVVHNFSFLPNHSTVHTSGTAISDTSEITSPKEVQSFPREVQSIKIEWYAGSIHMETANVDSLTFEETVYGNAKHQTTFTHSGKELTIRYSDKTMRINDVNSRKDLFILVPETWACDELIIDAGSADMDFSGIMISNAEINTASGSSRFDNCDVDRLEVNSASGSVQLSGTLNHFAMDAVSGEAVLDLHNNPDSIEMNTVSGDLTLHLPSDCGFTLERDSLSGSCKNDFPTDSSGNHQICGNGSCKIQFEGVSANINIINRGEHAASQSAHHSETKHH